MQIRWEHTQVQMSAIGRRWNGLRFDPHWSPYPTWPFLRHQPGNGTGRNRQPQRPKQHRRHHQPGQPAADTRQRQGQDRKSSGQDARDQGPVRRPIIQAAQGPGTRP